MPVGGGRLGGLRALAVVSELEDPFDLRVNGLGESEGVERDPEGA